MTNIYTNQQLPESITDVKPLPTTIEEYRELISKMPKAKNPRELGRRECIFMRLKQIELKAQSEGK